MDHVTPEKRSLIMAAVQSKNTKPEMLVRRLLHRLGYRFRLHRNDLPGTPDLVFPGRRSAIFVHGCFWHGHGCQRARLPSSNVAFWKAKISKNKKRDKRTKRLLRAQGWMVLTVWQCEMRDIVKLEKKLIGFLGKGNSKKSEDEAI